LVLLAITLLIGPWNILRKNRNPVSTDLRRDIGIWAGILGVLHTVIGQNVHLRGRPWLYYVYEKWGHHILPIRQDWFGLANYTGAISALLLIALLATSSDYALRSFGTPRWKQLQRWNYAVFALAAVHAVTYQANEKLHLRFILVVRLCIGVAVFIQLAGFFYRRHAAKFS
jgi:sulfoxide reductase heme-binding subunit YedZ